eukprot:8243119-Ditylum_brightwellii.AAC.1
MVFELSQHVFVCKAPCKKWHKAIVKLVMNGRKLYMVSWPHHTSKGWHGRILHPNFIRVMQRFHHRDQVQAQRGTSNDWHQVVIVCLHNHGACYLVMGLHCSTRNEVVIANYIIGLDPFEGRLRRYPNGFGMGHDVDFCAGLLMQTYL